MELDEIFFLIIPFFRAALIEGPKIGLQMSAIVLLG